MIRLSHGGRTPRRRDDPEGAAKVNDGIELDGDTLTVTRTFDAPRELVFEIWSDPDRIQEWSGSTDATSLEASVDFRVGGGYRHVISRPDTERLTMFGSYTEIREPERIVYTLGWEPLQVPPTTITVDFYDLGGRTQVRLTHAGLAFPDMRIEVPKRWTAAFEKLDEVLTAA